MLLKYIEDTGIYFFEVNTKYISSNVLKVSVISRVKLLIFSTHEMKYFWYLPKNKKKKKKKKKKINVLFIFSVKGKNLTSFIVILCKLALRKLKSDVKV